MGILLVFLDWVYTLISAGDAYSNMGEYGQMGFALGLLLKAVPIFLIGLLLGFIGKNKLVARCLKCKNKFDPADGIIEEKPEQEQVIETPTPEPVVDTRGRGDLTPTKSDVREFLGKIKEYEKTHKDMDQQWLDSLIEEYNDKFNEDFHQYV